MASRNICITLTDTSDFEIRPGTRVTVRFDERISGLHQECSISRKENNVVHAVLQEYSGGRFRLRIRLSDKKAVLLSPDYSWLPDPEDIVVGVVNRIAEMLNTGRSLRGCTVTRKTERISA